MSIAYSDRPPSARFLAQLARQKAREAKQQAEWDHRRAKLMETLRQEQLKAAQQEQEAKVQHRLAVQKSAEKCADYVYRHALAEARQMRNRQRWNQLAKDRGANRNRVRAALRSQRARESSQTANLLRCSATTFRKHVESQFSAEMSWENYGIVWQLEHIRPCSSFNLLKQDQQRQCFGFKNLRPSFVEGFQPAG